MCCCHLGRTLRYVISNSIYIYMMVDCEHFQYVLFQWCEKVWKNDMLNILINFSVWLFAFLESFTHMDTSSLPLNGCKFLTYTWHSWPANSEGSLACHTYCDTGHSFILLISENPWHLLPSVQKWSCYYMFNDIRMSWLGFERPTCEETL